MKLRPEEITSILKQRIEQYDVETDLSEVGTVLQVGDGIARVYGLENCVSLERLEFEHGVDGHRVQPRGGQRRRRALRRVAARQGGSAGPAHRRGDERARRRRAPRPRRRPARQPARRPGRDRGRRAPSARVQGAGRDPAAAGERAAPDRAQGDRLDDPDRPRPARADHRRPRHGQDRDRRRHDHQPARRRRDLHLRRGRSEGLDGRTGRRAAPRRRCDGVHDRHLRARAGGRPDQVDGPVRGRRDGRALPLQRQARARHLRRPDEARRLVPAALAPPAPAAGPRGVPG